MELADIVGYVGGFFSSISFLPQVIQVWKTKSAKDLSLHSLLLLITNVSLWLAYGIMIRSMPLMVTNGIVLFMLGILIYFKLTLNKKESVQ